MAANKILLLFAHPRLEDSRVNKSLINAVRRHPAVTFRDLYQLYPDFNIDAEAEKELLLRHNIIIWHHPFYWYSAPPLLKQWIDVVAEYGWAYGPGGTQLAGKFIFNAITSGGPREAYSSEGHNKYSVAQFLLPFAQTAHLCKMTYLPPFAVQGTHRLSDDEIAGQARLYHQLIQHLSVSADPGSLQTLTFLNDYPFTEN